MIVPSARLIWIAAVAGFPAVVMDVLVPASRPVMAAVMVMILMAAVADAVMRARALAGIRVKLPALLRLVQGREAHISVIVQSAQTQGRQIRIGFAMPEGVEVEPEERWVSLAPHRPLSQIDWMCRPRQRGKYQIEDCYLEAMSPLGLWAVRRREPVSLEIRIYPNLREDSTLQALRRDSANLHVTRQIGRGREFEKLREYSPGDSSDEIHWKATARRGHPITKVFQVERTQEVYLVIDASRLSTRPIDGEVALERAIRAALTVGAIAERRSDLFGVAAFADRVEAFVGARRGKIHYAACRDAINELSPRLVSPDFDEIATFLRLRLRRRALIVFLTSLDDPVLAEHFERATRLLVRRHLVIAGAFRPSSAQPLFHNPQVESIEDIHCALAGHLGLRKLRELQAALARQGVRLALLEPESFAAKLVNLYDDVKQRQLL